MGLENPWPVNSHLHGSLKPLASQQSGLENGEEPGALPLTTELFTAGRFKERGVVVLICDPLMTPPDSSSNPVVSPVAMVKVNESHN